jgi:hypothetical protein
MFNVGAMQQNKNQVFSKNSDLNFHQVRAGVPHRQPVIHQFASWGGDKLKQGALGGRGALGGQGCTRGPVGSSHGSTAVTVQATGLGQGW